MDHDAFAQLFGARFAEWNVFNSDHCWEMFRDISQMYLNDKTVNDIFEKSSMIPMGTLEDSLRYRVNDNDVPIIIYNHRLQTYKNYKHTFELLNELYQEGYKFKVYVTSSSAENTVKILSYPFVELKLCATREDYLSVLSTGDLNVTNSQHETFCMSAVESMALGQCLIAPLGITFPQITGKGMNAYPYLFTSDSEQLAFLRKLLTDKDERQKWGQVLSEFVRKNFSRLAWADSYAALIEDKLSDKKYVPGTKDDVLEDMKMRLEANDGCEIKEFWNIVAQRKINGRIPWGSQSLSYTKLGRLVRLLGGSVRIDRGKCRVYR
jgi:glycosyltransferase involved in cell wall biosynthesis